jgi:hypothetical protein
MSTDNRTLVIVACVKDKWKFEMLIRSMFAFLKPCPVIIIYNEQDKKYKEWLEWFTPLKEKLLKNFNVQTFKARDLVDIPLIEYARINGWTSQQVFKILAHQKVKTPEYVILDSKNFFMKHCSLDDILRSTPHGYWTLQDVTEFTKYVCDYFDMAYPGHHLKLRANVTPYIIQTRVAKRLVKKWKDNTDFFRWFVEAAMMPQNGPAEFILYELYELKTRQRIVDEMPNPHILSSYATLWDINFRGNPTIKEAAEWVKSMREKGVYISGIHSSIHWILNLKDMKTILQVLDCEYILPQTVHAPF